MPYPVRSRGDVVDAFAAALTPRTKLVVSITSRAQTALVMPVAAIAAACHARGVPVLVDGAHAPGSIALDIAALGADWYSANLHKWAHAPRSCGILWAQPEHQATLHHPIVSWGSGHGFHASSSTTPRSIRPAISPRRKGSRCCANGISTRCSHYMHAPGVGGGCGARLHRWGHDDRRAARDVGRDGHRAAAEAPGRRPTRRLACGLALLVDDRIEVPAPRLARPAVGAGLGAGLQRMSDIARLADAVTQRVGIAA